MQKLHSQYKVIPESQEFKSYFWYIAFVQVISNIQKVQHMVKQINSDHRLWAPSYQEYCKLYFELVLVDRLLYPGYIIIGLKNREEYEELNNEMLSQHLGYMLGGPFSSLRDDEFQAMLKVSQTILEVPSGQFNVTAGDNIIISSGPCAGLHGLVKRINNDGQVTLAVYFMNREITVVTTVTEIQNLGGPLGDSS
jgi:transcription antitermination factor NusG